MLMDGDGGRVGGVAWRGVGRKCGEFAINNGNMRTKFCSTQLRPKFKPIYSIPSTHTHIHPKYTLTISKIYFGYACTIQQHHEKLTTQQ